MVVLEELFTAVSYELLCVLNTPCILEASSYKLQPSGQESGYGESVTTATTRAKDALLIMDIPAMSAQSLSASNRAL